MNLILIFTIGALVLLVVFTATRSRSVLTPSWEAGLPDERGRFPQLPQAGLLARCFSLEDVRFAQTLKSPAVVQLLLRERRRLALQWLRLTRQEASRLVGLHVRAVRHAPDLKPAKELRFILNFGLFWMLYQIMMMLVRLYGPFHAQALVDMMQRLGSVLSGLGGRIADAVSPDPVMTARAAQGE